jgi:eukaryotic-like serine/threonine-protein kinase
VSRAKSAPRILIVESDKQYRSWLRHHLEIIWPEAQPDYRDEGEFAKLIEHLSRDQYDLVILSALLTDWPHKNALSLEWLRSLRRKKQVPPIVLIGHNGNELAAVQALRLGAADYLPRDLLNGQLLERSLRIALHRGRRQSRREPPRPSTRVVPVPADPARPVAPKGYELLRELGDSTRACVWLAYSQALRHEVALKISKPALEELHEYQSFAREHAAIAALRHTSVVALYDYGMHDGHEYLAMEYFPCGDLKRRLLHPISPAECLDYAHRIATALQAVHAGGLLHRDLKPPNIMLRADGEVVLIDFGLAKRVDSDSTNTAIGVLRGSPFYMSPEQVTGRTLDARSDLYSLGVLFYEMLTGNRPYTGLTAMDVMQQHVKGERPELPAHLAPFDALLKRLMAVDPAQRYADAAAVIADLERLAGELTGTHTPAEIAVAS